MSLYGYLCLSEEELQRIKRTVVHTRLDEISGFAVKLTATFYVKHQGECYIMLLVRSFRTWVLFNLQRFTLVNHWKSKVDLNLRQGLICFNKIICAQNKYLFCRIKCGIKFVEKMSSKCTGKLKSGQFCDFANNFKYFKQNVLVLGKLFRRIGSDNRPYLTFNLFSVINYPLVSAGTLHRVRTQV